MSSVLATDVVLRSSVARCPGPWYLGLLVDDHIAIRKILRPRQPGRLRLWDFARAFSA